MTKNTSYHSWSIPETGDTDYASTLDTFWTSDLDTEVIEKDTKANRPSAGTSGRWFLATDEPAIYYDDGGSWNKIGGKDLTGETLDVDNIKLAQGTGTPYALHFNDDTNTGLYRTGANAMALGTGGTDAISIDSSQNVTLDSGDLSDGNGNTIYDEAGGHLVDPLNHEPDSVPSVSNMISSRPLFSQEDRTIYVDPDSGDDSNDGTSSNPFQTIDRAFEEVPYWLTHKYTIDLANGTYDSEPTVIGLPPVRANFTNTTGHIEIIGDTATPSNVKVGSNNQFVTGLNGTEPADGLQVKGVELNCQIQAKGGVLWLEDCNLHSDPDPSTQAAIAGYDSSVVANNCTFGGDANWAVDPAQGGTYLIENCDGSVSNGLFHNGGQSNCLIWLESGTLSYNNTLVQNTGEPGFVYVDGEIRYPDVPNSTLVNDSITLNGGDGLANGSSASLGNSFSLDVRLDIDDGGSDITGAYGINFGSNLSVTDDGDNTVTVDASSGTTLTVQDDGSDIETSTDTLDFGGTDFSVANPNTGEAQVSIDSNAIGTSEIDESIAPTWTSNHIFDDSADLIFGTDSDYELDYDAANTQFEFHVNGGANIMTHPDGNGGTAVFPNGLQTQANFTDSSSNTIVDNSNSRIGSNYATATSVDFGEGLEDNGSDVLKVKEPFSYDPGMTSWEDGLSNEEIDRIVLQSGETLVVERIEFRQKGGGSSSSASIDVRDTTAASTVGSQNLGGTTKDPGSSGSGNTVIIRVNNSTGGPINAAPRVHGYIEGA